MLLDGHDGSDRQPDGFLVVHVDKLGVASRRFPTALDPANFCKEKFQELRVDHGKIACVEIRASPRLCTHMAGRLYLAKPYSAKSESAVQESGKPYFAQPGNC